MAAGMSFSAVFSAFAAIYVGFAIAGLIFAANAELQAALVAAVGQYVPGLIGGSGDGAVDPDQLFSAPTLGWSGIIALGALVFTMLGWLATTREAVRSIFELHPVTTNFILLKLQDLALAVGLGVLIIASAALQVVSNTLADAVAGLLGIPADDPGLVIALRTASVAISFVIDVVTVGVLYRVLARVPLTRSSLARGAIIGGLALTALKFLGTSLLGGVRTNPLLASFAVLIGLLLFFNLISRALLYTAAFVAEGRAPLTAAVEGDVVPVVPVAKAAADEPDEPAPKRRHWWQKALGIGRDRI